MLIGRVIVLGKDGVEAVIVVVIMPTRGRRAAVQVGGVAFAPEAGEEEGVAGAKVVSADAGALQAVDGFVDHVADAAGLFGAGDAEEACLFVGMKL